MISRLTFCAALFAAVTTVSLAYAADSARPGRPDGRSAAPAAPSSSCRGRSDRQARPLKSTRDRRGTDRAQRLPGRTSLSCGPFLLPERFRRDGNPRQGAQGIAPRYRNGQGRRSHGGNSCRSCPARHPHDLHGKPPAAALLRRIRDQRRAAVARLGRLRRCSRPHPAQQSPAQAWWPCSSAAAAVVAGPLPRAGRSVGRRSAAFRSSPPPWRWRSPGSPGPPPWSRPARRCRRSPACRVVTLLAAYAHSLFATPGLFRASAASARGDRRSRS